MSDRKMAGSIGSKPWITRLRDNDGGEDGGVDGVGNPIFPWKPFEILSVEPHAESID